MGNLLAGFWNKEPPPPMVLVPPIFDFPPLTARTRMLVPAYDLLFGKLALRCLFEDYFEKTRQLNAKIMLKPLEDPHVDLVATVSGSLDRKTGENVVGNALFRWQRDLDDPHTFMDIFISTNDPILRLRSCAYYPKFGFGAFGIFPMLSRNRLQPEDYGVMGLRYGSEKLSFGAMFMPFPLSRETPISAWVVGRTGRLSLGVKYDPPINSIILSACCSTKKGEVNNPFEENQVVGITNYIDFGFELTTRIDGEKPAGTVDDSSFQIAASWQANKNLLLKGKTGPSSSAITLAFKSWWKPSFTFSITAINDRLIGMTSYGFGIRVENIREPSYQRADPNYVMLTPNKEHLAEGVLRDFGKRPMFQSEINSGNYDQLPRELKPIGKIF
ncbi:hypothetical protein IEQ34_006583 [Dendrobium chrysotoxum]|uniref:Uncharacterized protein n=1 Tax=Dendrobium chrysotoxum TaxID=161865 RepID=A0AAV7H4E5_DENCH|nr:hypothetical protein IEQ34_006583 [Dendrobium chrysotoxum]